MMTPNFMTSFNHKDHRDHSVLRNGNRPVEFVYLICRARMPPLLLEVMPSLAKELEELLAETGYAELSGQVRELRIVDRCRCGDDFCATFYTQPRPSGSWGLNHYTVPLDPSQGTLNIDVVGDKIACVEVLYRDEIRKVLHSVLP